MNNKLPLDLTDEQMNIILTKADPPKTKTKRLGNIFLPGRK